MIVPDQSNIKIHFAGAEKLVLAKFIHDKADVNYNLFTVYPFIRKKQRNDKNFVTELAKISRHTIMDSGLFTLMFGAEKGKKSEKFMDNWVDKIIEFILETGYKGTYVDADCQKVLGVNKAWEYRRKLRAKLPNRQINVFHIEDGKDGLDRLIEYSDYIAISVPELRAIKKKEYLYRVYSYIKNKKPEIDIHLLGFTEFSSIEKYKNATSCDSVSWKQASMYGQLTKFDYKERRMKTYINVGKASSNAKVRLDLDRLAVEYEDEIREYFHPRDLSDRSVVNYVIDMLVAREYRKVGEYFIGSQK